MLRYAGALNVVRGGRDNSEFVDCRVVVQAVLRLMFLYSFLLENLGQCKSKPQLQLRGGHMSQYAA